MIGACNNSMIRVVLISLIERRAEISFTVTFILFSRLPPEKVTPREVILSSIKFTLGGTIDNAQSMHFTLNYVGSAGLPK